MKLQVAKNKVVIRVHAQESTCLSMFICSGMSNLAAHSSNCMSVMAMSSHSILISRLAGTASCSCGSMETDPINLLHAVVFALLSKVMPDSRGAGSRTFAPIAPL